MTPLAQATQLAACPVTFAEFYRATQPTVYRTALQVVRRAQDAEEIANDAFLRFLRSVQRGMFRGECAVETYLHTIARRASLNRLKHNWVKRHFGTESFDCPDSQLHELLESADRDPCADLELEEMTLLVQQALPYLVASHQQVIYLRLFQRCSYEEIAQRMNIEVGTVKSTLARARLRLRQICERLAHDPSYWQTKG